jgi:hypothetical protein
MSRRHGPSRAGGERLVGDIGDAGLVVEEKFGAVTEDGSRVVAW